MDIQQTTKTGFGTVYYERGLEIVDIEGCIEVSGTWVLIFGDPDLPPRQQRHTALPVARIVGIDYLPVL